MSAIIEPESAHWRVSGDRWADGHQLDFLANREDRNLTITRRYPNAWGVPAESIELTLDQLAEVEAALLNARLWLERAVKQRDELRAAEEVAADAEPLAADNPGVRVIANLMMLAARR